MLLKKQCPGSAWRAALTSSARLADWSKRLPAPTHHRQAETLETLWLLAERLLLLALGPKQRADSAARVTHTPSVPSGALLKTFTSLNSQTDGDFGWSVAVSGTTVVVGTPFETVLGHSDAGRTYTFNDNSGSLIKEFVSPNSQTMGEFGSSVAISGTTMAVGAPNENASGNEGAGHVYTFNPTTGKVIKTLASPNSQYFGSFGSYVGVSGSTIVAGAPAEYYIGRAYTFSTSGARSKHSQSRSQIQTTLLVAPSLSAAQL